MAEPTTEEQNKGKQTKPTESVKDNLPKYALSIVLMIAILALTFFIIFREYSADDIFGALKRAKPFYVLMGFLMMAIYQFCVAINLQVLLQAFSDRKTHFSLSHRTAYIGFYFNNITPSASGGQPMEMYYLAKHNYPLGHTTVIFILLALFYNFALIAVSGTLFALRAELILQNLGYVQYFLIVGIIFFVGLTVAFFFVVYKPHLVRRFAEWGFKHLKRFGLVKRVERWEASLENYLSAFEQSSQMFWRQPKLIIILLISSIVQIVTLFCVPAWVVLALGGEPSGELFVSNVALQAILYLSSAFIPTPGAVGVTEASFLKLFRDILGENNVAPAMVLTRIINLYGFLIISGIISAKALIFERPKSQKSETGGLSSES